MTAQRHTRPPNEDEKQKKIIHPTEKGFQVCLFHLIASTDSKTPRRRTKISSVHIFIFTDCASLWFATRRL